MALGDLTKQIAAEALRSATTPAPAPSSQPDSLHSVILGQVQAMQRVLKEDEELVVLVHSGGETIRVLEFFSPTAQVLVMTGTDSARNTARVISPVESVQLVCKAVKVPPQSKAARINFVVPRPRADT